MNTKINETSWLWHHKFAHISMHTPSKIIKKDQIFGLPKINFEKDKICDARQLGKQTRVSFKPKNIVSTSKPLELLHMDLFDPTRTTSLGGKRYDFIIIDDFLHFTWSLFLASKDEVFSIFSKFCQKVSNKKSLLIISICSNHDTEFENKDFKKICDEKDIDHNFLVPRTPQQNEVIERKNIIHAM